MRRNTTLFHDMGSRSRSYPACLNKLSILELKLETGVVEDKKVETDATLFGGAVPKRIVWACP